MQDPVEKLEHLKWAIESRVTNHRCALKLLSLFTEFEEQWKTKRLSRAAQDLLSVSFSLWRAAFLANKTGTRRLVFAHGKIFLEKIIEDNAISYTQDKGSSEWTFNYYTRNARQALESLHEYWHDEVPKYVGKKRDARTRWDYCQELLDIAVTNFEQRLKHGRAQKDNARTTREVRNAARDRRRKSREFSRRRNAGASD